MVLTAVRQYSLVINTKQRIGPQFMFSIDMYSVRNEALNVVVYKIYYSYYVVQWSLSASSPFEI
jgi:hypothetical protein